MSLLFTNKKVKLEKDGTISKLMDDDELEMFLLANSLGLTPEIIKIDGNNVTMKKYECTLGLIKEYQQYSKIVDDLITKLHDNHILHGDLHSYNIVVNLQPLDIKLIDFELAVKEENITPTYIRIFNTVWTKNHGVKTKCITEKELFECEHKMYLVC